METTPQGPITSSGKACAQFRTMVAWKLASFEKVLLKSQSSSLLLFHLGKNEKMSHCLPPASKMTEGTLQGLQVGAPWPKL